MPKFFFFSSCQSSTVELEQLDVKTAFLHFTLEETLYIILSNLDGYEVKGQENKVCLLPLQPPPSMVSSNPLDNGTRNLMHSLLALVSVHLIPVCIVSPRYEHTKCATC